MDLFEKNACKKGKKLREETFDNNMVKWDSRNSNNRWIVSFHDLFVFMRTFAGR